MTILGPRKPLVLPKRVVYLPEGYKKRKNKVVSGRAKSGEVGPSGLVSHTEDWEGRVAAAAGVSAIRLEYSVSRKEFRRLSFEEMVARGYFRKGVGPTGIRI